MISGKDCLILTRVEVGKIAEVLKKRYSDGIPTVENNFDEYRTLQAEADLDIFFGLQNFLQEGK